MARFRLTIGENGTAWGKQSVVFEGEAENAVVFVSEYWKDALAVLSIEEAESLFDAMWVDAGADTLPIAVQNLAFRPKAKVC